MNQPPASPSVSVDDFTTDFISRLHNSRGVDLESASDNDLYSALAWTVRKHLIDRWLVTKRVQRENKAKTVAYLSAEYLLGAQLHNMLLASGLGTVARESMASLGLSFDWLAELEVEPGLGNGGLGRLAACFVDSLATLDIPATGYGIRYQHGIFRQTFVDGRQVEQPDNWLELGSPWEFPHPEASIVVHFGGHVEHTTDAEGNDLAAWKPAWNVLAVPYNYLVPGYGTQNVNSLRLWSARATQSFDLQIFNSGDYENAVRAQTYAENISQVLYPEDSTPQGKELRLQQQYFFVAASVQEMIGQVGTSLDELRTLPQRVVFQLNDTHPVIAIPEMMRLLVDVYGMEWDEAWGITRSVFNYTCHTLLPEALEVWSVDLLGRLLPRHLEIIYRINDDFVAEVRESHPGNELLVRRMSIIQEQPFRAVRMAHLATVGSTKVNGVAALHSELLKDKVLVDFSNLWPEKFTNVTNGVTPRRFVKIANPGLSSLIDEAIGTDWVKDLSQLSRLEPFADDAAFREQFRAVKAANKTRLVETLRKRDGIELADDAIFDVMVKRLHEYKRQMLKVLHVVTLYDKILRGELDPESMTPRVVIFGAKAAPGYLMAKEIIALINAVGATINADPRVKGALYVAFPANYNVTLAETLIPAADLSEQISLAGKEASGTGNMKFALNGALTIGTLDGANVEIRELVGDDNFFLFGLTEPEVATLQAKGYVPSAYYEANASLKNAIDLIASGAFSGGNRQTFEGIVSDLLWHDRFLVLADYQAYIEAQNVVESAYADQDAWAKSAILNVARSGFFSSDRSIRDYLDRIWHTPAVPVQ
ncbi:glycogen/starch/alpha-glucan phosphorylase [Rarobacter incanus]|uniref:Alpha-1,4 glucan phosphorylase n=1 Tax=Rarobacter incanus TaxID=153494 RepID=A0A542SM37_9MICO|nr:glycogen/starch/alpha-glucan phosphorylase [Rarobacter incanus]TQK75682.1 starch phosphorylase [Rarobacter incanus]